MRPTATCGSCGAPIVWATTSRGNVMPVDAEPVPGGNIVLVTHEAMSTMRAEIVKPDPEVARNTSHFATCPDADRHRRARPAKASGPPADNPTARESPRATL